MNWINFIGVQRQAKTSKLLSDFAIKLIDVISGPYAPEFNIQANAYELYKDFVAGQKDIPLSKIQFFKVCKYYGLKIVAKAVYQKRNKKDPWKNGALNKHHYGLQLEKNKLEIMAEDLKGYTETNGMTIIFVDNKPYQIKFTMVPVNNQLSKALSVGRSEPKISNSPPQEELES